MLLLGALLLVLNSSALDDSPRTEDTTILAYGLCPLARVIIIPLAALMLRTIACRPLVQLVGFTTRQAAANTTSPLGHRHNYDYLEMYNNPLC